MARFSMGKRQLVVGTREARRGRSSRVVELRDTGQADAFLVGVSIVLVFVAMGQQAHRVWDCFVRHDGSLGNRLGRLFSPRSFVEGHGG